MSISDPPVSVPIGLIKRHLNLDHDQDDGLLMHYGLVAAMWVSAYCDRPFDPLNALMMQAMLLLVAHSYEAREAVTFSNPYQLPFGVRDLLAGVKRQNAGPANAAGTSQADLMERIRMLEKALADHGHVGFIHVR